jgi:hypothetical protein
MPVKPSFDYLLLTGIGRIENSWKRLKKKLAFQLSLEPKTTTAVEVKY